MDMIPVVLISLDWPRRMLYVRLLANTLWALPDCPDSFSRTDLTFCFIVCLKQCLFREVLSDGGISESVFPTMLKARKS